jgi:RNA polymerase sigma-32 factor
MNVKEREVVEMSQRMDGWDVSLESPVNSDSDDQQKSFIPADEPGIESIVAGKEMKKKLKELLDIFKGGLNDKQTMILDLRLLSDEPLTLQKIADRFNISRERVRQIEIGLLKKMRIFFETEMPDIICFFDGEKIVI